MQQLPFTNKVAVCTAGVKSRARISAQAAGAVAEHSAGRASAFLNGAAVAPMPLVGPLLPESCESQRSIGRIPPLAETGVPRDRNA